jgi:hypothetical protein
MGDKNPKKMCKKKKTAEKSVLAQPAATVEPVLIKKLKKQKD